MKKTLFILTLGSLVLFAITAMAADKVVVIPLQRCADGLTNCSGKCVDTMNNPNFCGNCTTVCGAGRYCSNGICIKVLGDACLSGSDCLSGICVDGVCCDTACSSLCESCTSAKTEGVDGTCGFITAVTDPDNECDNESQCDGLGACIDYLCEDGIMNGWETDVDCGGANICPRCELGQDCIVKSDCTPYSCSMGVCTDL